MNTELLLFYVQPKNNAEIEEVELTGAFTSNKNANYK